MEDPLPPKYKYEYKDESGWMTTTNIENAMEWYYNNTMILFMDKYMTIAQRNKIVHKSHEK